MTKIQLQLTEAQCRSLDILAAQKQISVAELIGHCIDRYLHSAQQSTLAEQRQRALSIAGRFASEETDLSVNHDKYLAEIYSTTGE